MRATLILLGALAATPAFAMTCPTDTLSVADPDGNPISVVEVVTSDTTHTLAPPDQFGGRFASRHQQAAYDLSAGALSASAALASTLYSDGMATFGLAKTHEEFALLGPPDGGPVAFTARLSLGSTCSGQQSFECGIPPRACGFPPGSVLARFATSAEDAQIYTQLTEGTQSGALTLPLVHAAGESFVLDMLVQAEARGYSETTTDHSSNRAASISGTLAFPDLPAGYTVVSCHGYAATGIVPTRATTWGRLKTRYR